VQLFFIRLIGALLGLLPYGALLRLGSGLGWLLGRVIRHRRSFVMETLARCLPERTAAERAQIADGMYRHLATLALECLYFSGRRVEEFSRYVDIVGAENVAAIRAQGTGALALMGHIGNWELMGLAAASLWQPVSVVVKPIRNQAINSFWRGSRERMGLRLLPRDDAMRDCLKALKRKEAVALILDQNMRRHRGIFVNFFGTPACTTPGLAFLSAASQTAVIPIFMIRKPNGRHELHIRPHIPPPPNRDEASIRDATQHYTLTLENIIREYPDQWTWLHKRWRTQPESAAQTETERK